MMHVVNRGWDKIGQMSKRGEKLCMLQLKEQGGRSRERWFLGV